MSETTLFRFAKSDDDLGSERDRAGTTDDGGLVPGLAGGGRGGPAGVGPQLPLAVVDHGEVFACSATARVEGVRRGMRRRDASARCPELTCWTDTPGARRSGPSRRCLSAVEEVSRRGDPDPAGTVRPRRWPAGSTAARCEAAGGRRRAPGRGRACGTAGSASPTGCSPPSRRPGGPPRRTAGSWIRADRRVPVRAARRGAGRRRAGCAAAPAGHAHPGRLRRAGPALTCSPASAPTAPGCTGWPGARTAVPPCPGEPPLELDPAGQLHPGWRPIEPIAFSTRQTAEAMRRRAGPARAGLHRGADRGR